MEIQDEELKLQFLVSGSYEALPPSYLKLRSYLNAYSANLANLYDLRLPNCFTKTNLTCLQCFLPWSPETCSMKLLPVKNFKKRFSKTKTKSSKAESELKVPKNHLILKCKFCNSRTHFYLQKKEKTVNIVKQEENKVERIQKKKKKKKKDKTCGLRHCSEASLKKSLSSKKRVNKTKSSGSKCNRKANLTASIKTNVQQVNFQSSPQLSTKNIHQPSRNKKFCSNSNAVKVQCKTSKNRSKHLQKLKQVVQGEKKPLKTTLKDFLTVI